MATDRARRPRVEPFLTLTFALALASPDLATAQTFDGSQSIDA
jgi:hypothetical protein